MRFLVKISGVILSISLIFAPTTTQAKQKNSHKHKVSHHHNTKEQLDKSRKNKKYYTKYSKRKVLKVSYYYGPKVYASENIEPNTEIYRYAVGLLGTRYKFGGESINGIDCSSFVQNVFELAGYKMPRTAREQARYGYFVRKEDLKPGDLLFFATYASFPSHVGIYIGEGRMIHASSRGNKVEVTSIDQGYYQRRFLFAKRIPANLRDLEDIKDIENFMGESINEFTSGEIKKDIPKFRRNSEVDPISKLLEERNGN